MSIYGRKNRKALSVRVLNAETGRRRILASRSQQRVSAWRMRLRRLTAVLILLLLAGLFVFTLARGIMAVGSRLLWENEDYRLRTVDITVDGSLSRENVMEFLGLPDDINLWSLLLTRARVEDGNGSRSASGIEVLRRRFLRRVPSVSEIELAVRLPDSLHVRVTERVPFAVIDTGSGFGDFVIDRHGVVFFEPRQASQLPRVTGFPPVDIRPGIDLSEYLAAALHLLDSARLPEFNRDIRIRRVNAVSADMLECWLDSGAQVGISWVDMSEGKAFSDEHLKLKLQSLRSILRDSHERGREIISVDLTLSEDNIPVVYQ